MIDPHRLRVFRAVVAEGSIGGAARSLGYTSSAVSQHIAALQRETGLTLVERDGRGVTPTAAGRIVAEESAAVFDQLARIDGIVHDLRHGRAGRLSVSYFASASTTWIPPIVATITGEFPSVRLDLRLVELADDAHPEPDIEVYVDGAATSDLADYDCEHLITEPYIAVVHADSPLARREEVPLEELSSRSWVDNDLARGPCRQRLLDACAAVGFSPDFTVQTQDYPTAIRFVAAGVGLTVVPELALVGLPDGVVGVRIVDPTPTRAIWVRRHGRVRESHAADRVLELLRTAVSAGLSNSAG
ncbi:LysR family transcriptional regulator [Gordonia sp. CPCC 206044]|uniref:LysR family transcriptional regulator n=1 Tax=Gordonia sp. CPCC 206044 TaxID=3140793 RepID=UPI003AF3EC03